MGSATHGLSAQLDQGLVLVDCECFTDAQIPFDEKGILSNSHALIMSVGTGCTQRTLLRLWTLGAEV